MKHFLRVAHVLQAVPQGDAIKFAGALECSKIAGDFQAVIAGGGWIHFRAGNLPTFFPCGQQESSFAAADVEEASPAFLFRCFADQAQALRGPEDGCESVPSAVVSTVIRRQIQRHRFGDTQATSGAPQNGEALAADVVAYRGKIGLERPATKKAGL